jgi:O-antigen biosynthesis protein
LIRLLTRTRGLLRRHKRDASAAKLEDCNGPSYSVLKNARIAQQRKREVDIVICVHNGLEYFRDCLASVLKTLGHKHRVIVVDDASDKAVGDYLRTPSQFGSQLCVHRNESRTGYTRAANIGLRLSSADFVILLNSDTIVAPNWIEKLCDAVYTTDGAGIIGPLSSAASFQSIPNHLSTALQTATNDLPPNMSVADVDLCCEAWTSGSVMPQVPLVHGFCFGIRRAVLEKIGLFDEGLFPDGYGEENDYCFRASDAGFGLVIATQTYVFHAKTKSYTLSARSSLAAAAERKVRERHGDDRVNQALQQLESNCFLKSMRLKAAELYGN